jgi:hypothetical protein
MHGSVTDDGFRTTRFDRAKARLIENANWSRRELGFVPEPANPCCVATSSTSTKGIPMAVAKKAPKKTARGRAQDRAKIAGGQKYEVSYEAKKTGRSAPAVKKVGNVRKTVEKKLARRK